MRPPPLKKQKNKTKQKQRKAEFYAVAPHQQTNNYLAVS